MNPNEENSNNPSNNPADTSTATPEPADAPASAPEPEVAPTGDTEPTPAPAPETPATTESTPTPPVTSAPQKKSATLTLILIIIAAILVVTGVVVTIMLISNNSSKNNSEDGSDTTADSAGTTLVCTVEADASEIPESLGSAVSYEGELNAYYDPEDNLESIEISESYGFSDEQSAKNYIADQETAYDKVLANLNLASDPFGTSFSAYGNTASIYRFAEAGMINKDNASIFMLKVNEDGTVDTSMDGVEAVYTGLPGLSYSCDTEVTDDSEADDEEVVDEEDTDTETDPNETAGDND